MGILKDILRRPRDIQTGTQYQTFTEYAPSFSSFAGNIYSQELTRACISRIATACASLNPEITGESHRAINRAIHTQPNQFETWPTFLQKVATRYEADATAYVIPVFARDLVTKVGFASLKCVRAEIVEYHGVPWMRFYMATGETQALPLSEVCILSKYSYLSDFFSDPNCLEVTMKLIHGQNEAQRIAMENGAKIRFIGALNGQVREEDMKAKRERFVSDNLTNENSNGLMLYDQTFSDIRQVEPKSYVINASEMERIDKQVYNYFGINEKILQNDFDEDTWGAFYEGKVEPFAIRLGEGLTHMCYTQREQQTNRITFSSSRIQYASTDSKRSMIRDGMDRGVLTVNQSLEMLQLPTIGPAGDVRYIRGEYKDASTITAIPEDTDGGDDAADTDNQE